MKCGKVRDLFSRYLENAMDGALSAKFEEHLAGCPACRAAYDQFSATVLMLDEIPEVDPPADFHASVMARVELARRATPQPVRWWQIDWQHVFTIRVPARAMALGFATLIVAGFAYQMMPPQGAQNAASLPVVRDSGKAIAENDPEAPKEWAPWQSTAEGERGLMISVAMSKSGLYSIRLGTRGSRAIEFSLNAGGKSFTGVVAVDQDSVVSLPAPKSGVSAAKITWKSFEQRRDEVMFLPAKFERQPSAKSITLPDATMRGALGKIADEYGIVVIASGDLDREVSGLQLKNVLPDEAFYGCLQGSNMKSRALASSVFTVEPAR